MVHSIITIVSSAVGLVQDGGDASCFLCSANEGEAETDGVAQLGCHTSTPPRRVHQCPRGSHASLSDHTTVNTQLPSTTSPHIAVEDVPAVRRLSRLRIFCIMPARVLSLDLSLACSVGILWPHIFGSRLRPDVLFCFFVRSRSTPFATLGSSDRPELRCGVV